MAIPCIVANLSTPLLVAVTTALIGRLDDPVYLAGVSVGTLLFDTLYWLFGFLRVLTTGFSAQSLGNQKREDKINSFFRPFYISVGISALLMALQVPIWQFYIKMINPAPEVAVYAARYFYVLIWGAPAVLINYVFIGWLMGQAKLKEILGIHMFSNVLNIILALVLVNGYHLNVLGVAAATLTAQYAAFFGAFLYIVKYLKFTRHDIALRELLDRRAFHAIFQANSDLMIRTCCILAARNLFTAGSASFGTAVLAANAVISSLNSLVVYVLEGIANASSIFAGKAVGYQDERLLKATWRKTAEWGCGASVFLTLITWLFSDRLILLFTEIPAVVATIHLYTIWLLLVPLSAAGVSAVYGIFSGTTVTKPIRDTTVFSLIMYLVFWNFCLTTWGNDGLWLMQVLFNLCRSFTLVLLVNKTLQALEN